MFTTTAKEPSGFTVSHDPVNHAIYYDKIDSIATSYFNNLTIKDLNTEILQKLRPCDLSVEWKPNKVPVWLLYGEYHYHSVLFSLFVLDLQVANSSCLSLIVDPCTERNKKSYVTNILCHFMESEHVF